MRLIGSLKVLGFMLTVVVLLATLAVHYRDRYHHALKQQQAFAQLAESRQRILVQWQEKQRVVADIDAKHTRELADAKATINELERRVITGEQRLRLHAQCQPVSANTPAARLDDAARARLTDAAQRDYFTLRKRIESARHQIAGLQDYVRQCGLTEQKRSNNE